MTDSFPRLKDLSPQRKRALLAELLRAEANLSETQYPLSHGQQALWFLYKLAPESAAYNVGFPARIRSALDQAALQRSFQILVDRHPMLRTTFTVSGEDLVQISHAQYPVPFEHIDATDWDNAKLHTQLNEEIHRPFDLEHGPVLRIKLFTRVNDDPILFVGMHHIAGDFWSLTILMMEFQQLYKADITGQRASLSPVYRSYADFVRQQADMLNSLEGERLWKYWHEHLVDFTGAAAFPTDRPHGHVQSFGGATQSFRIPVETTAQLKSLAQTEEATLFMVLLAAFQLLLGRYSGQDDVVVGSPVTLRNRQGFENVVGYFVNLIVLRADLSGKISFRQLLASVRQVVINGLAHREFPFPLLIERLGLGRDVSRPPLVSTLFVLEHTRSQDFSGISSLAMPGLQRQLKLGDWHIEPLDLENQTAEMDMTLLMEEVDGSLYAVLQYNSALFDSATIERIVIHYQRLLDTLAASPDRMVSQVSLLNDTEERGMLCRWNNTKVDFAESPCVHELFEEQAKIRPHAVAISLNDQEITYELLNAQANRLARHLQDLGVRPGITVGVYLDRSIMAVVSLLGIFKSGGVYVPLDSEYPTERVQFMMKDSEVQVLMSEKSLLDNLSATPCTVVCLDDMNAISGKYSSNKVNSGIKPRDISYIIYTSGSTGKPKGVAVSHDALVNRLRWSLTTFDLSPTDRFLGHTSISFDVSLWEIFGALTSGGQLILVPTGYHNDPVYLVDLLYNIKVTVADLGPSLLQAMLAQERMTLNEQLRCVTCGGEVLPVEIKDQFLEQSAAQLYNCYGPTESTIDTTFHQCSESELAVSVPIGRPIANVDVYVLDRCLQVLPIGVPGELYIGGRALAHGYWQHAELTAEKFIPHPFSAEPGARLYKSGDVCRWCADGELEFVGRVDQQVKLRGYRIELGEIEAQLRQQDKVKQAIVVVRRAASGHEQLVAYVVAGSESILTPEDLRDGLSGHLPGYMVPSTYVVLDKLPELPNGKINYKALPIPEDDRAILSQEYVPPRTDTEARLASIWSDILGVDRVGAFDNFFDLGGHSLLATQVVSRIRQQFDVELPLRSLFEQPTVATLAGEINAVQDRPLVPPITPASREQDLPLSYAQQRLWFLDQLQPDHPFYNVPGAARLRGPLNVAALQRSLQKIVDRHESLRTIFTTVEGRPVQNILDEQELDFPIIDLRGLAEHEQQDEVCRQLFVETRRPFILTTGPLLHVQLYQLGSEDHVLQVTMHHIVSDGWSLGVLLRELMANYGAECRGVPASVIDLPIQYADYALWQRQWLNGGVLQEQLNWWKEQMTDVPLVLHLPTDHPRPNVPSNGGAHLSCHFSQELTASLRHVSRQEGVTLFMTLLSAWQVLLSRYSGQLHFTVGSPIANRHQAETEQLIGFFVNMLVMVGDLRNNPRFVDHLAQQRHQALAAYAHQDVPFEQVVEYLNPGRDMSRSPLFQVVFALQNAPLPELRLTDEVSLEPLDVDAQISRFDLELHAWEHPKQGLELRLLYSTDLFERETVERLVLHFEQLLTAIVSNPKTRVAQLKLLGKPEYQQLLVHWNRKSSRLLSDQCVHLLFEQQVQRTPDAVALVFKEQQMTYEELNRRSNQLAHYLRDLGVAPDVPVGICVERSPDMIIGLLAILKAGGAFVPLDPDYPQDRLTMMLDDIRTPLILGQQKFARQFSKFESMFVNLDEAKTHIEQKPNDNPANQTTPDHLVYILFTSGSTGKPKGVQIQHTAVERLVFDNDYATFGDRRAFLQLAPVSFDASTFEIWGALLHGGRLVLAPEGMPDFAELEQLIQKHKVTTLWLTATLFNLIVDQRPELLQGVEEILTGGEALSPPHIRTAQEVLGSIPKLINGYGPTESTTFTTCYPIPTDIGSEATSISIGRPIAETEVYVLDSQLQAVPIGVAGELYIGGVGLARGYRNRPELTGERFIPNPFSERPGSRLYKTGDKVRWLANANLDFLGRLDHQVKIRGHRIELGEIEAVLCDNPLVKQTVVVDHEDKLRGKQLIAYVVADNELLDAVQGIEEQKEHVAHWQTLYDETYLKVAGDDPTFNVVGWNSSYTGKPIAVEQMRVWRDSRVAQLMTLHPERVLEIGCGTGLLLLPLAPHCRSYQATDFSQASLDYVQSVLDQKELNNVTLSHRLATDFDGWAPESFDLAILNSVVQYFPSVDYLLEVLDGIVTVIKPGGHIFIGDVRNLSLLEAFHADVEFSRASDLVSLDQLATCVKQQVTREDELVLDPRFFTALQERWPRLTVRMQLQRGRSQNELTRFRYDALLRVDTDEEAPEDIEWQNWTQQNLTLESLREHLQQIEPEFLGIQGVPNKRIQRSRQIVQHFSKSHENETVGRLRQLLRESQIAAVEPEDFWDLSDTLPYVVRVTWSIDDPGCVDVLFQHERSLSSPRSPMELQDKGPPSHAMAWEDYSTQPLRRQIAQKIIPSVRSYLTTRLPEYMIPAQFVMLESMPLLRSGKVNRRELPAPDDVRPTLEQPFVAPRNDTETRLVAIWSEVLGIDRVGVLDNFFALGGHSLLATQVMSRISHQFSVELPLRRLFEQPNIATLATTIEETRNRPNTPPITPVSREQELPLSYAQQRLWFLDQLIPGSSFYNMPGGLRFRGSLNLSALEKSLNEVVHRHEVLRTTFLVSDGQPRQIVHDQMPLSIEVQHLCDLPEDQRERQVRELAYEEVNKPFDLTNGPLLRVALLRLAEQDQILLITIHHVIFDGWSTAVLIQELLTLYKAFLHGHVSPLQPLPIQYADYAYWQRKWLEGQALKSQLAHWKEVLADLPQMQLPLDHPRPKVQRFEGATHSFQLSDSLSKRLQSLSQDQGVTLFMTLLAAFQVLLARWCGQDDIVVGTPVAGRNQARLEDLMGFFVNTLVLRTDLSGNFTFLELLARVREVCLGAFTHQDIPYEKLVEELQPERDLSRESLFQVMFALQPELGVPKRWPAGLNVELLDTELGTAQFDLTMEWAQTATGLFGKLEYNTDLFDATTIQRLSEYYRRILAALVSDPLSRPNQVMLMSPKEKEQILKTWSGTTADFQSCCPVHQIFAETARQHAAAIAVEVADQRITYEELNARANRLARYLQGLGVGPDAPVGVCLPTSIELMECLLGILKAGGVYVPLDPDYPEERLQFMIEDGQVQVLLTQRALVAKLPNKNVDIVCRDDLDLTLLDFNSEDFESDTQPGHLAYIIYTSGSTGQPKGVGIPHSALANRLLWSLQTFKLNSEDRFLGHTSPSFDVSLWEIFGALLCGGRLTVASQIHRTDPIHLVKLLWETQITIADLGPSLLQMMLPQQQMNKDIPLRVVTCGGEVLPLAVRDRILRDLDTELYNCYGPTESAIDTTFYHCQSGEVGSSVPIGHGIANAQVYVLDRYLQIVPVGVPGELYIGGLGLARGYWRRPWLTAEKFIPHPFSSETGARLFKSGDICRWRADGMLEFVGRVDEQVKVRGYRIELHEIEATLLGHVGLRQAVVTAFDSASRGMQLAAYIVPDLNSDLTVEDLRVFLQSKLPVYMVPAIFVFLEELPSLPNGKVNRKKLPTPDFERSRSCIAYAPPRTDTERALVNIWQNVLGAKQVGIHDNFFVLGGHSLLAVQIVSRVRDIIGVELPLVELFQSQSIAELAPAVDNAKRLVSVPLQPVSCEHPLPLSFAQQRLWFLDQLLPNNAYYNMPAAIRLLGIVDVQVLQRALNLVIERHEVLRTTFGTENGEPVQVVHADMPVEISIQDLSDVAEDKRLERARTLAEYEAAQPFNLTTGPLVRVGVIRFAPGDHIVLLTMHHIVSDGWSTAVLIRELYTLYDAICKEQPYHLKPLSIQYGDYAYWQRQYFRGDVLSKYLDYWRERLANISQLNLPTDYPRPTIQSFAGATYPLRLSTELSDKLKLFSQENGVTLFMTMLTVFKALLSRYSGQTDIVVGSPVAGRNQARVEDLIGFFVNMVVLRTDVSGNPTFLDLLARVKAVCLGAYSHQDVPYEKVVETLQPQRDLSREPLFQVVFIMQSVTLPQPDVLSDLQVEPIDVDAGVAKFDLTMEWEPTDEGLVGHIEYNTDLFVEATIVQLADHYQRLLTEFINSCDKPIGRWSVLAESEQHRMLVEWNGQAFDCPNDMPVHICFTKQSEKTPNAVAAEYGEQKLSYHQLNQRANQFAHFLLDHGVGRGTLVGICLERSLDLVVALIGILKTGASYVPIDAAYPTERMRLLLEDAAISLLLAQKSTCEQLPNDSASQLLLLEECQGAAACPTTNPNTSCSSDDLIYVMYTSGSTGRPKGVAVPHRGVVRLVKNTDYVSLAAEERFLLQAPLAFDASTFELWAPLLNGATLVISPLAVPSPERLAVVLEQRQITTLWLTAALFELMVQEQPDSLKGLRQLLAGGDVLSSEHVAKAKQLLQKGHIINGYGPTENTTFTCCHTVNEVEPGSSIPIGRPIAHTQVYVLDRFLQPAPIGAVGELYTGGHGVARGYWQSPELTAQQFVPDSFGSHPGARLYKVGDLCRWRLDGMLEFLGRLDHQVKIRGFRIELGEIETVLLQHPSVRQAVVVAHDHEVGSKRLAAYVVPADDEGSLTIDDLRDYLQSKLPEYMVPSWFTFLSAIPVTDHGKVDRRTLPRPDSHRPEFARAYVPPTNAVERTLTTIWQEVLKVDRIGIHDNFFALGGHSLLATQIMSRTRQCFAVELPLRLLFEHPTITALARAIEAAHTRSSARPIVPVPREQELPLSHAQQRLWFLDQLIPNSSLYNMPAAFRFRGPLDRYALQKSLDDVIQRHEILRTTFAIKSDGQPRQVIHSELSLEFDSHDLQAYSDDQQQRLVLQLAAAEAERPFDLAEGPLMRASLFDLAEQDHVMLLTMHHVVFDGWSTMLLIQELRVLYEAYITGNPAGLEPLPIQYADYAYWQRQWLAGDDFERQLSYWRDQLADVPQLQLPIDFDRPTVQRFPGALYPLRFSAEQTKRLEQFSQNHGVTLFMTMLAAFQALLARHTGQTDIVVGSPVAGRNHAQIEALIGFFVNMLVLRTDFSGNPSFADLLERVRETCLGAYSHQDVPYEKLVEILQPQRDLSREPLFQIVFSLQTATLLEAELPNGLRIEPLDDETRVAKFDLTMEWETTTEGLVGYIEYNTDLFSDTTIARMATHYEDLLTAFVTTADQPIGHFDVLTPLERRELLVKVNATAMAYSHDKPVHELVAEQADRTPDALALAFGEQQLSYQQLNRRANQLAHYLQDLGVRTESLVAVCLERSFDWIIVLLSSLKTGGTYVPLDPDYPSDRLRFMLDDSQPQVVVTHSRFLECLGTNYKRTICVDIEAASLEKYPTTDLSNIVSADQLAYIIYTSGSMGLPKGVGIPHRGLTNRLLWAKQVFTLTETDRVLSHTSPSFDVSLWEVFAPLLVGGQLVLAEPQFASDPSYSMRLLTERQITVADLGPSLLRMLFEQTVPPDLALRCVTCGGEVMPREVHDQFLRRFGASLYNCYGPTETSIDATYWQCCAEEKSNAIPIGGPIANTEVYVLDRHLQPVPHGVPGELHIGGVGVARGYWHRPELTATQFVPHPFSSQPGNRLYRTGDVCRWRADGQLEFVGRADQQVKLRGYRIELGEIEAVLEQHPALRQAAVTVFQSNRDDQRLVAYVVADSQAEPKVESLRDWLQSKLPAFMVPGHVVFLDEMPLTLSGKVDRNGLPAFDGQRAQMTREYVAPRNDLEKTLSNIWQEVLSVDQVGIHDNFFESGGHSLLAVSLAARMRKELQMELPIRTIFQHSTIADLGAVLEQVRSGGFILDNDLEVTDLSAEAVLEPEIRPINFSSVRLTDPRRLLLTGATGFLGVHLLSELLQWTDAEIYCLVRGADLAKCSDKIHAAMQSYQLWDNSHATRIIPLQGDLASPQFGLNDDRYNELATKLDGIYHNGAYVDFFHTYSRLKPANVLGTREAIRLACAGNTKALHFVSTLSVFADNKPVDGLLCRLEDDPLEDWAGLNDGYSQSKWVAEKLVWQAAARGLPVTVHRPGRLTPHTKIGIWPPNDLWYQLLTMLLELKMVPESDAAVEMTPVDYVSRAIVHISRQEASLGQAFHLANTEAVQLSQMAQWLNGVDRHLSVVPMEQWQQMMALAASGDDQDGQRIMTLMGAIGADRTQAEEVIPEVIDCRNTLSALTQSDISCPRIDEQLLEIYLATISLT